MTNNQNYKDWLIPILVMITLSCSNESETTSIDFSEFMTIDSLELELPEEYLSFTSWTTYQHENQQILVEYGLSGNSLIIHQIDFLKGKYLEPIIIPQQGPNGYNSSGASVYFKNQDSLFVFPTLAPDFYLYNGSGQLLKKISYNSPDNSKHQVGGYYSSAVFLNENMIIPVAQRMRFDDPQIFTKSTPVRSFDFDSEKFIDSLKYPNYTENKTTTVDRLTPTITAINQDSLIINFRFSDSLYFWNPVSNTSSSLYLSSDKFGKTKLFERYPDRAEALEYNIKEVDFITTLYHNDRIYRIISYVSQEDKSFEAYEILQNQLRKVALLEYDLVTKKKKLYHLPLVKYFTFIGDFLFVGGVSIREDGDKTFRKFYRYQLE